MALLYPKQGEWTEENYLALDMRLRRLIEYDDGSLEFLPVPTISHQLILAYLWQTLHDFVKARHLGTVLFAPLPVRLWQRKWREPDIVYLSRARVPKDLKYPKGADLAIEIVSEDPEGRERDLEIKRVEYAKARIPEYWIVDPEIRVITVLSLARNTYKVHGTFRPGTTATSIVLPRFSVPVDNVFKAGRGS